MAISAQLFDGTTIEFPDGTDPSVINATAKRLTEERQNKLHQNKTQAADLGTDLKRGIMGLPGAVTGLLDVPVAAVTGKPMVSQGWDEIGNITGFQPSKWADEAAQRYSPQRQESQANIDAVSADPNANGWAVAGAHLANPMAGIVGPTVQSLPAMLAGGYGGAKALGGVAAKLSPAARQALIAGGGEGAISAGMFRDDQTKQGVGTANEERVKSLGALGAGVGTGLISGAGGAIASKMGIVDPDALFAKRMAESADDGVLKTLGAMTKPEIAAFRKAADRGIATRVGLGMVQEGLLEELPQSAQEKMWQNWVENKPVMQNVGSAAIQGGLSGALMGGAFNARRGSAKKDLELYDKTNAANLKKAEAGVALQTKLVEDSQNAAAKAFVNDTFVSGQPTRQEALNTALSGLLQTSQGVQDVIKNPKNYFPDYSQDEIKAVKKDLLALRNHLKATEKAAPATEDQQRTTARQADLDAAFNAMSPEEAKAFKEPTLVDKPEATTYTPEVLKKLKVNKGSNAFKELVDKPIGTAEANTYLKQLSDAYAEKDKNPTLVKAITQHLESVTQTKPVSMPDQTTVAALAEKVKAGTVTPAELQQLKDVQEKINGNQNPNPTQKNKGNRLNTTGTQSGMAVDDVGGVGTASSAGQTDEGAVGLPSGSTGTDVGGAAARGEPLAPYKNEITDAATAKAIYDNPNSTYEDRQEALVYAILQSGPKDAGGTTVGEALKSNKAMIESASRPEIEQATKAAENTREAWNANRASDKIVRKPTAAKLDAISKPFEKFQMFKDKYNDLSDVWSDLSTIEKIKLEKSIMAESNLAREATQKKLDAIKAAHAVNSSKLEDAYQAKLAKEAEELAINKAVIALDNEIDAIINNTVDRVKESRSADATAERSTSQAVKAAISNLLDNKYWTSERIHVVDDISQVPEHRRSKIPNTAQAVAFGGNEVWMIANRIRKGAERGVFLHEVGVHLGMQRMLGAARIKNLAARIDEMELSGTAQEQAVATAAKARAEKAGVSDDAEEIIAYFVEEASKLEPKTWTKRIAAWFKELRNGYAKALKKAYLNPEALSGDDIVALAKGAAKLEIKNDAIINERYKARRAASQAVNYSNDATVHDISELADEAANEYHTFERSLPPTMLERLQILFGKPPKAKLSDWLMNGLIGTGESWRRKEQAHYGNYGTVNGKELGFVSQQRATGLRNLVSGAMEFGKLVIDSMGVVKVQDSAANAKALYAATNDIYEAMRADGVPETGTGSLYDMFYHMAYADRYAKAKENNFADTRDFSMRDVEAGRAYQQQYADQWDAWQDIHQEMRAQTMDFMVQSGAFTPAKARLYLDRVEYIPFSREEQEELTARGNNAQGLLSGRTEYHIKGDDAQIKDPMVNIVSNQEWLMQWGIKNNSANLLANSMTQMHADTDGAMGGKWVRNPNQAKNVVKMFVGGEAKYLSVIDPIDMAIFEGHPTLGMASMGIFHAMTGILRKGVTLMPSFHFRQLIEDPLRATAISGNKPGYVKTATAAWKQFAGNIDAPFTGNARETAAAKQLRHLGIVGQRDYQDTHDNFLKELSGETIPKWRKALEYTESIAQANDLSTRSAVYEQAYTEAIAEGLNEEAAQNKASYKALMLINFNNRGNFKVITALMNMVPFINARIQGDSRMYQALIGKNVTGLSKEQASKMVMMRLANLAAFTMLYALARGGDDDYESAEQHTRDGNFLFNVGGLPMKFPVPPELGFVKTGVEQAIRQMSGNENSDSKKVYGAVANAFTTLVFGPSDFTPTIFKPMLENMTNHSFFTGRDLVGQYQQGLQTNEQKTAQTSAMAIAISDMLQNLPEPLQVSPIKVDNLIRGWLGTTGSAVTSASDIMFGDKPDQALNQAPGVGGMFYNPEGGGLKNDFYTMLDQAAKAKQTLTYLQKNDTPEKVREFIENNKVALQMYPKLNSIKSQLDAQRAQLNRALQGIKTDRKSPTEVADLKSAIHANEMRILKGMPKLREQMGY